MYRYMEWEKFTIYHLNFISLIFINDINCEEDFFYFHLLCLQTFQSCFLWLQIPCSGKVSTYCQTFKHHILCESLHDRIRYYLLNLQVYHLFSVPIYLFIWLSYTLNCKFHEHLDHVLSIFVVSAWLGHSMWQIHDDKITKLLWESATIKLISFIHYLKIYFNERFLMFRSTYFKQVTILTIFKVLKRAERQNGTRKNR